MSDQHTATALRLMNDPLNRHGRLEEVAAENPDLGLNGYGHDDDQPPRWPQDQLRRALLWLAVCEPRKRLAREGSYALKHQAERLAGGYVSNGALICAALMCGLRVQPRPSGPNARIALKAPATGSDRHLLACRSTDCTGACLLANDWAAIRAWKYPALPELVGRAGFLWVHLSPHIQHDLDANYQESRTYLQAEESVYRIGSLLTDIAPEAHHAWGWCDQCDSHHIEPCNQERLGL